MNNILLVHCVLKHALLEASEIDQIEADIDRVTFKKAYKQIDMLKLTG